jgi:single-strand DNA-binding protein
MNYLPSGSAVVNFSVATTDRWKDKETGADRERTEWHRISFFGRRAEVIAEWFRKGDPIYVEGSIQTDKYEKDGETKYATKIKGRDFQFLKSRSDSDGGTTAAPRGESAPAPAPAAKQDDFDDDIPF